MQWLQDKKNLPIVIGVMAVIIIAAAVFLFMQMKGGSSPDNAAAPADGMGTPGAMPPGADGPPGAGGPPGALPGPPGAGGPPGATPGPPGASEPGTTASAETQPTAEVAANPLPLERWRDDPFAPFARLKTAKVELRPKLDIPMPARLFLPPPPKAVDISPKLIPQPPRRVAGILYSDRVNALLQTPDGWETVKPGDTLRDGTLVERIERDRVVLRTTDDRPRLIEVKLAASAVPLLEQRTGAGDFASPLEARQPGRRPM